MSPSEVLAVVARAALTIPSALKDTVDLVRARQFEGGEIERQLSALSVSVDGFFDFHRWLRCAKTFHDGLTALHVAFEPAFRADTGTYRIGWLAGNTLFEEFQWTRHLQIRQSPVILITRNIPFI